MTEEAQDQQQRNTTALRDLLAPVLELLPLLRGYLSNGGLFNPEMMEHDKVRDLIMRVRDELARLREIGE